ncbi:MAG TPA: MlaD family protein [Polyangiales bacterium]|nr:MlaD family protein [Polyangiales bacterium]
MPKSRLPQNLRVGSFVTAALAVFALAVFLIGQERAIFVRKTRLHTSFLDINGLVVGAPVRLAGLDVGRVTRLDFDASLARPEARVEFAIEDTYMPRVRKDSFAYIDSKGLLGDKLINLTVGTANAAPLADGDFVQPRQGMSFEALAQDLRGTARAIGRTAESATAAVDVLATPELAANLQRVSASLANLLEHVENGPGLAHALVYDPKLADSARTTLEAASRTAQRLDTVAARIERGPGSLHGLIYEDRVGGALTALQRAGEGVATTTDQLNGGDGLAAALLRDPQGKQLLVDLADVSARLQRMAAHVERGDGTLGALVVDPSVYEDMKTVLGNIERNTLLKSLIRMTIKQEDFVRPAVEAKPVAAQP